MSKHTITINTNQRFRPLRYVLTFGAQFGVIGVGVLVGSTAMQWMGFFFLCLMFATIASKLAERDTGLTFDEARARIAEIEAGEIGEGR